MNSDILVPAAWGLASFVAAGLFAFPGPLQLRKTRFRAPLRVASTGTTLVLGVVPTEKSLSLRLGVEGANFETDITPGRARLSETQRKKAKTAVALDLPYGPGGLFHGPAFQVLTQIIRSGAHWSVEAKWDVAVWKGPHVGIPFFDAIFQAASVPFLEQGMTGLPTAIEQLHLAPQLFSQLMSTQGIQMIVTKATESQGRLRSRVQVFSSEGVPLADAIGLELTRLESLSIPHAA